MATTKEYLDFVLEQLGGIPGIDYKKMFGEYLIYIGGKPALLVCDNTVFVKKLPELASLLQDAPEGLPYEGTKPHYMLDVENRALTEQVLEIVERVTPLPKPRKKKPQ